MAAWKEKYNEDVIYSAISPEENIANFTLGKAAKDLGVFSRKTIARDIVKIEDPEGEIIQVDREQVEEAMPELKAFRVACGLAKRDKTDDQIKAKEAEIINWRLDKILSGELPPITTNSPGQPSMPNLNANIASGRGQPSGPEKIVSERVRRKGIEAGRQGQNSNSTEAK